MAKNCNTCKQLEWVDGECITGGDSGYICIKRNAATMGDDKADAALLAKMDNAAYRNRYKRCFEPRDDQ